MVSDIEDKQNGPISMRCGCNSFHREWRFGNQLDVIKDLILLNVFIITM